MKTAKVKKTPKLKPCPFCGSEAVTLNTYPAHPEDGSWYVQCTNHRCCASNLGAPYGLSPKRAAIPWNRRAGEDKK